MSDMGLSTLRCDVRSLSELQGYFFKAGALKAQDWITIPDTAEVTIRGQVAQTIGMRLLFFFPVSVRRHCVSDLEP